MSGDAFAKDVAIDVNGSTPQLTYSFRVVPDKYRFYDWLPISSGVTATPSATPTWRCPGSLYADICPGDVFYSPVSNLTGVGAISR